MIGEVARCRLGLVALGVCLLLARASISVDAHLHGILPLLVAHAVFATTALVAARRGRVSTYDAAVVTWLDGAFAIAVGMASGPATATIFTAYVGFAAVAALACGRARHAAGTIVVAALTYGARTSWQDGVALGPLILAATGVATFGCMLVRLLGMRLRLAAMCAETATADRRQLARYLHDGCAALLAAIDVRIEANRQRIDAGRTSEALADLAQLRARLGDEQRQVRALSRRLGDVATQSAPPAEPATVDTRFSLDVRCEGSASVVEAVLAMLREAMLNVERHARAARAVMRVRADDAEVHCEVTDDGVGCGEGADPPWSIASRANELGGSVQLCSEHTGARLSISLPRS
jgi:signal transduction histidine kinase